MIYKIITALVTAFFKVVFFMKAEGRENVPKEGGLLLCTNHRSYWDPPAVAVAFPRKLRFMAKEELFRNPAFGWLIRALGAFPIRRGKGDAGAIMTTLKILNSGETTLVFPEGTRVHGDDGDRKVTSGIIRVAIKARVPIVPGYTNGKYRLFGGLKVCFGKPISYEEYYDCPPDAETLERLTHELMRAIYSFSEEKPA
ncbi:MAG: lysophospholipid acyltransferase family protein [Clostridia bacterium]